MRGHLKLYSLWDGALKCCSVLAVKSRTFSCVIYYLDLNPNSIWIQRLNRIQNWNPTFSCLSETNSAIINATLGRIPPETVLRHLASGKGESMLPYCHLQVTLVCKYATCLLQACRPIIFSSWQHSSPVLKVSSTLKKYELRCWKIFLLAFQKKILYSSIFHPVNGILSVI